MAGADGTWVPAGSGVEHRCRPRREGVWLECRRSGEAWAAAGVVRRRRSSPRVRIQSTEEGGVEEKEIRVGGLSAPGVSESDVAKVRFVGSQASGVVWTLSMTAVY